MCQSETGDDGAVPQEWDDHLPMEITRGAYRAMQRRLEALDSAAISTIREAIRAVDNSDPSPEYLDRMASGIYQALRDGGYIS